MPTEVRDVFCPDCGSMMVTAVRWPSGITEKFCELCVTRAKDEGVDHPVQESTMVLLHDALAASRHLPFVDQRNKIFATLVGTGVLIDRPAAPAELPPRKDDDLAKNVGEAIAALKAAMTAATEAGLAVWVGAEEGDWPDEAAIIVEVTRKYRT